MGVLALTAPGGPPATALAQGAVDEARTLSAARGFLDAYAAGDAAPAASFAAADLVFVDARPCDCTPEAPCTDPAAVGRALALHQADRSAGSVVVRLAVDGPVATARLEERSWYRGAVGPERTITDVVLEVRDGLVVRFTGTADLSDPQTRSFEAFHTGWAQFEAASPPR